MKTKITINRADLSEGNFSTISNEALYDVNLSSSALRLLQYLSNGMDEKELKWSSYKLKKAMKCLIDNNYI